MRFPRALAALSVLALLSCGSSSEDGEKRSPVSKDAKLATVEMLRADLEATRHPADGGGRAWLAARPPSPISAGSRQRFEIVYEAGPLGVEEGGAVFLQTSPFWAWDSPQIERPESPGYTEVETDAPGVELEPLVPGADILAIGISGRKLEEGERIRIVYGAGPAGARVDRFAEAEAPIWIAVDGDGDGVRSFIEDVPRVDVVAARPARLVLTLPSTARPGDTVRLTAAVVDGLGNGGLDFEGELVFEDTPEGVELPERVRFETSHRGARSVNVLVRTPGVYRLKAAITGGLASESNPLVVRDDIPRILWGDLHGHSQLSDGTGTPEDYFWYAKEVAGLDVIALTDHDHWGMRFLDQNPEMWERIQEAARRFEEPGRFIAIAGYEWTNWLHGHRHVLYFEGDGEIFSALDPRYETPSDLWDALKGRSAITVAHHSAGGPVSTNWDFIPEPEIEPVTEVVSVHGVSEAPDAPGTIYNAVEGNFVRDVLDRGVRFGFIGSGDSHDGHPGLAHLASPSGGLAAIFSEDVTRESVLEALRARRVYATNGRRIWLRMWLDDRPMGSILPISEQSNQELRFAVAATAPIERIDLVRSGEVSAIAGEGRLEWSERIALPRLRDGEYLYLRVLQRDGGMAWTSPVFARAE